MYISYSVTSHGEQFLIKGRYWIGILRAAMVVVWWVMVHDSYIR